MRSLVVGLFALFVAFGCAGKSTSQGGNADGNGGRGGSAGVTSTGGTGVAGSGGNVAVSPFLCLEPPESGTCEAYFERYAFDARTGTCRGFVYGGCGGNANNFETAEECHATCANAAENDFTVCESSRECAVAAPGCCGACEPVLFKDVVAVNSQAADAHYHATCPGGGVCGGCAEPTGTRNGPWLGATCRAGHCVVFDAREIDLITSCNTASDCRLRAGLNCCEGCIATEETTLAINQGAELESLVCGEGDFACDACAPAFPENLIPDCIAGRCVVQAIVDE